MHVGGDGHRKGQRQYGLRDLDIHNADRVLESVHKVFVLCGEVFGLLTLVFLIVLHTPALNCAAIPPRHGILLAAAVS